MYSLSNSFHVFKTCLQLKIYAVVVAKGQRVEHRVVLDGSPGGTQESVIPVLVPLPGVAGLKHFPKKIKVCAVVFIGGDW
jgi:hypothetical protein